MQVDKMLGTFVDKATSIISNQFWMAYWFPTFIAFTLSLTLNSFFYEIGMVNDWWKYIECAFFAGKTNDCGSGLSLSFLFLAIILITIIAYLLQIFNRIIVRFFEGYWKHIPWIYLWNTFIKQQIKEWNELKEKLHKSDKNLIKKKQIKDARFLELNYEDIQLLFPKDPKDFLPTKLGNIIRSAEKYSEDRYGMSCAVWWPRLWPLLLQNTKSEIDDSLTPMVALLNLAVLMPVVAVFGILIPLMRKHFLLLGLGFTDLFYAGVFLAALIFLFWFLYEVASTQAVSYGMTIRTTVDLNRFEIFKWLHIHPPDNSIKERMIWAQLHAWLQDDDRSQVLEYTNTPP